MRIIYCDIKPFVYEQNIYIYDGHSQTEIGKTPIENLPQFIVNQCDTYDIEEVNLTGILQYATDIADKISEYSKTKYNNRNIKVTVR